MAKESMKAREVKRAKTVAKYAEKRKALKEAGDFEGLQKLPKNASPIRMHNRCKLTGRPKGYMRQFGISRVMFREMANKGLIPLNNGFIFFNEDRKNLAFRPFVVASNYPHCISCFNL